MYYRVSRSSHCFAHQMAHVVLYTSLSVCTRANALLLLLLLLFYIYIFYQQALCTYTNTRDTPGTLRACAYKPAGLLLFCSTAADTEAEPDFDKEETVRNVMCLLREKTSVHTNRRRQFFFFLSFFLSFFLRLCSSTMAPRPLLFCHRGSSRRRRSGPFLFGLVLLFSLQLLLLLLLRLLA
uniref:Uncharacterized protein n=1 Tax=Trypanosoma vivax (strain Y486) TaxID=1055687 RepID=G0U8Y2_TRYVY|nr:hypothetical protein TVY486_1115480 [Trypanosoma vivax Y486]